jgi:hypothetical protein
VSVSVPAPHTRQSLSKADPVADANLPATQPMQLLTSDRVLYLPASQAVQRVAPVLMPVLVMDPAAHTVHSAMFDFSLYRPALQPVHSEAPCPTPVLVT